MDAGRPHFASDYGISTEPDGMLAWSWVTERLAAARNYWIGTTRPDGRPHVMPVWALWLDEAIVFSTDPGSTKGRNLLERPDIVIHLESGDEVVVAEGRAERLAGDELPAGFVDAYDAKYGHRMDTGDPAFGFFRLRPAKVLAWREADFPTSATCFTR